MLYKQGLLHAQISKVFILQESSERYLAYRSLRWLILVLSGSAWSYTAHSSYLPRFSPAEGSVMQCPNCLSASVAATLSHMPGRHFLAMSESDAFLQMENLDSSSLLKAKF